MKPFTVLVAEYDLLWRMVLERSVVQWGYQLVSAADGESARDLLKTHMVDLCIMDWQMPKMSGLAVCQWLRSSGVNSPYVILITGKDQPEDIQAGYEAGADDYLTKPCDLKYLRRRIATVAEKLVRQDARNRAYQEDGIAGLSPLDIYLSDLRLMRRKS